MQSNTSREHHARQRSRSLAGGLLCIDAIYHEPAVPEYARGREILDRFPDARRIEVPSHWNIPELHGDEGSVERWNQNKRTVLVLGTKKGLACRPFYRSCDFVAPSQANGCAMACSYCVETGTLISTPEGQVPVEQIRDGASILAYDSSSGRLVEARADRTASREVDEVLEIRVGGRVLRATEDHPLMIRRGWVRAGDLTEDDEALCDQKPLTKVPERDAVTFQKIESIKRVAGKTTVHNFHVPGPESYVANGMVTHNCYVARRKGYANPITTFVNIEEILGSVERHAYKQGIKFEPTQADPDLWVYEFGTNSDLSVDAAVSDNVRDVVGLFRELPNAKATFATKFVNRDLLDYDPQGKTRLRFSLMPPETSKLVDVRTSKVEDRISAINDFVEAGYEVNVNFGPVIVKEGWQSDYAELFGTIDAALSREAKAQLAAEIIFLTHSEESHEVNLRWHPEGEKLLWRPDIQEHKTSQASGERVLRYERNRKRALVREFRELLDERLPYCEVRYAF